MTRELSKLNRFHRWNPLCRMSDSQKEYISKYVGLNVPATGRVSLHWSLFALADEQPILLWISRLLASWIKKSTHFEVHACFLARLVSEPFERGTSRFDSLTLQLVVVGPHVHAHTLMTSTHGLCGFIRLWSVLHRWSKDLPGKSRKHCHLPLRSHVGLVVGSSSTYTCHIRSTCLDWELNGRFGIE